MSLNKPIALIGVPTNSSGTTDGVARAPKALREAGLLARLAPHTQIHDLGDIPITPPQPVRDPQTGIIAPQTFYDMVNETERQVKNALDTGWFPLVIGGDCGLLLGCLSAARTAYGQTGLLFVDGHEDAYPPHDSTSGETADMEMGLALGRHLEDLPTDFSVRFPLIGERDVAILGARDYAILAEEGFPTLDLISEVVLYRDDTITLDSVGILLNTAFERIQAAERKWWLHVDLDVLSTDALPSVDYQQAGGLDWETLTALTRKALHTPNLIGWDITIYNPDLDPTRRDASRIVDYIASVLKDRSS